MSDNSNEMHLGEEEIEKFLQDYIEATDRLGKFVRVVVAKLEERLAKDNILAKVTGRVKSKASLEKKLWKWAKRKEKADGIKKSNKGLFEVVGDLAAVRVMTYVEKDRERVVNLIKNEELFRSREGQENFEKERKENDSRIKNNPSNFYRATHLQIRLVEKDLQEGNNSNLERDHCELQITSMLAHVWNEIEHDIGYKTSDGELSYAEKTALESIGMLTKAGDNIISHLIDENVLRKKKFRNLQRRITNKQDLEKFLQNYYGDFKLGKSSIKFNENSKSLFNALVDLDYLLPEQIIAILTPKQIIECFSLSKGLASYMKSKALTSGLIDPHSCDALFIVLLKNEKEKLTSRSRHGKSRGMTIGRNYEDWLKSKRKR